MNPFLLGGLVWLATSAAVLAWVVCRAYGPQAVRRAYNALQGQARPTSWAPWGEAARWPDVPASDRRPFDWARD